MPATLHPTAAIATDVVAPADPGLAFALARALLEQPRMANHEHGLWGYTGQVAGCQLTVQATGIGGPSAACVLADLVELGARRVVRVGSCVALDPRLGPGDAVAPPLALPGDGTSLAIAGAPVDADGALHAALGSHASAAAEVSVVGVDLLPVGDWCGDCPGGGRGAAGACDRETAALYALGARLGVAVAALLAVSGPAGNGRCEAGRERLLELGAVARLALASAQASSPPVRVG